jgi:hypothetical protein
MIWVAIFQYCTVKVALTMIALITQATGRYCIETLKPAFAHVWIIIFQTISVTIAMFCLVQFYKQVKEDIAEHRPLVKVAAIKLVIFLSFWQTIILSLLTAGNAIKPSKKIQEPDLRVGLPVLLLCMEMAVFALFHFWSFPDQPYRLRSKQYLGGPLGIKAILDALNAWDIVKAVGRSARWIATGHKIRHQDASYDVPLGRKPTGDSASQFQSHESLMVKESVKVNSAYATL